MDLFNQTLDLYWTTEVLLGKVIVERGEMKRHMGVIRANLIPLCSFCYHLRTIEAKENLLGNYVGLIFRVATPMMLLILQNTIPRSSTSTRLKRRNKLPRPG